MSSGGCLKLKLLATEADLEAEVEDLLDELFEDEVG